MPLEVDIDEIVRQVIAQLSGNDTAAPKKSSETNQQTVAPPKSSQPPTGQLEITERLVTLATLENRLTDIRHVVLRRGAVVTPAARDVLRDRGIGLSYTSATNAASTATIVLGVAELTETGNKPVATALVDALVRDGVAVERIAATGLASVVSELADHASRGGRPTILLTSRPDAAVCLANRVPGVRAVGGPDVQALRRAMTDVAANLLALDPAVAAPAFRRLISEFLAGWPRRVPAVLDVHFPRV